MAFTGKLGTADSRPGNLVPGFGSTSAGPQTYDESATLAGVSAFSVLEGMTFQRSLSLDVTSNFILAVQDNKFFTLTLAAIADFSSVLFYLPGADLTLSSSSEFAILSGGMFNPSISFSGSASFFSPGGAVYTNTAELANIAGFDPLAGFGYFKDITLDAIADTAQSEIYVQNLSTTLDAIADFASTHTYVAGASLTLAGSSALSAVDDASVFNSLVLAGFANFNIENIYAILLDVNASAGFLVDRQYIAANNSNNPLPVQSGLSFQSQLVALRTALSTLSLTQTARGFRSGNTLSQSLVLSHSVSVQKVRNESITHTLALTDLVERIVPASNTLVFSQLASVTRVRNQSIVQTLVLTHSATRTSVYNRTASNTLVFPQFYTPINTSIILPVVNVNLKPRHCIIRLSVPEASIILPCPLFGDVEIYSGLFTTKRTMNGDTFNYIRNGTNLDTLRYSFIMGRKKSLELRSFFDQFSDRQITMENWKGEVWLVNITSNPLELTKTARWTNGSTGDPSYNQREKVEVALEFEGIKLY